MVEAGPRIFVRNAWAAASAACSAVVYPEEDLAACRKPLGGPSELILTTFPVGPITYVPGSPQPIPVAGRRPATHQAGGKSVGSVVLDLTRRAKSRPAA